MRIGIDARFYGPFGKGLGRYVQKLIEHLERLDHDHEFVIFLRSENWEGYAPHDSRFRKVLANFPWYSFTEQWKFPRLLHSMKLDLIHFPHYNVPLLYRHPFVVTIHDLILSRYPTRKSTTLSPLWYAAKHAAYRMVIASAVRRAQAILTVSEYSKLEILRTFSVDPQKVVVTYEAAEPLHSDAASIPPTLQKKHAGWQPYLLYVGNAYPHKNLETLLQAFRMLKEQRNEPLRLVLVGQHDFFYRRLQETVRREGVQDVIFAGSVMDRELASLYHHALLYVFPSLMEGFGLPPLEAMLAGLPVASSNRTSLPEILGDAAFYFDPEQPQAIVTALQKLLSDEHLRHVLRERGKERVKRFQWEELARRTLAVYTEKA